MTAIETRPHVLCIGSIILVEQLFCKPLQPKNLSTVKVISQRYHLAGMGLTLSNLAKNGLDISLFSITGRDDSAQKIVKELDCYQDVEMFVFIDDEQGSDLETYFIHADTNETLFTVQSDVHTSLVGNEKFLESLEQTLQKSLGCVIVIHDHFACPEIALLAHKYEAKIMNLEIDQQITADTVLEFLLND